MKYVFLLSTLSLVGCATWFPASVRLLDDGSYQLSATGNSFASMEKMKEKLEKKARSLCDESGFDYVKKPGVAFAQQKDYTTGLTSSYKTMSTNIKCVVGPSL